MIDDPDNLCPWLETGQKPYQWLAEHFHRFVYSPWQIAEYATPWPELDPPADAGLYFLLDELDQIAYVGVSNQVNARLVKHCKDGHKPMNKVWVITGIPPELLEDVEAFYIYALNPPLNNTRPLLRDTPGTYYEQVVKGDLWAGWEIPRWAFMKEATGGQSAPRSPQMMEMLERLGG